MTKSELSTNEVYGTVLAVQANFYQVRLELPGQSLLLLCTRRSRLKKIGQQVMVGDRVSIEEADYQEGQGAIARVFPRKTELTRPPIANAEQILLVFAIAKPDLEPWQLSRFLVKAESTVLAPILVLNKIDLVSEKEQQQWRDCLEQWGYNPVLISVKTGAGLEDLQKRLQGKITIVTGVSGAGKSSLINQLIPDLQLRVAQVSGKLERGRHTTRHVELFELSAGGLLADSPGFDRPTLDITPASLALYFPEARQRLMRGNCQFSNCLHQREPNCIVREDWQRYEHYLKFLEEAVAIQTTVDRRSHNESNVKIKIKELGTLNYEPKLEVKKYRRSSRRIQNQSLQNIDLSESEE